LVGREASVNGSTQIRAGVMRPEIVIPRDDDRPADQSDTDRVAGLLEVGASVRVIRDPYFGVLGSVTDLPAEPQALGSESRARVLCVETNAGETVTVPRANVELIEE
ncbi:MAG: hypothetical protein VB861_17635, partial [Planctomycetaceae bacterium]